MDEDLSEMLREWGERGPTLITAVLEERNRVLEIAAHQRDALSAELFESQSQLGVLRDQAHQLAQEHHEELAQASASIKELNSTVGELRKDLEDAKRETERLQTRLKQATGERDKALCDIEEREKSSECILAALQKSMHSEARAKTTAMDSIHNLEQENLHWSKLVSTERTRATKEQQRADAAEKQVIKLQRELNELLEQQKLKAMETAPIARPEKSTETSTIKTRGASKRRKTALSQSRKAIARVGTDSSVETQLHDDDMPISEMCVGERAAKKRMLSKQPEKRRRKSSDWNTKPSNNGDVGFESKNTNAPQTRKSRPCSKRKIKTCPSLAQTTSKQDRQQQEPLHDQHVLKATKPERPRRNVPQVSYVYPLHNDCDVQTRDKFCVPEAKAHRR